MCYEFTRRVYIIKTRFYIHLYWMAHFTAGLFWMRSGPTNVPFKSQTVYVLIKLSRTIYGTRVVLFNDEAGSYKKNNPNKWFTERFMNYYDSLSEANELKCILVQSNFLDPKSPQLQGILRRRVLLANIFLKIWEKRKVYRIMKLTFFNYQLSTKVLFGLKSIFKEKSTPFELSRETFENIGSYTT